MRLRHAMVDASDFHGQGVDRQRRDEFNNGETRDSIREGTVKQCRPGRQRTSGQELTACKSTRTEVDSVT